MAAQYDVFISYRRSDGTELAKAVRDYLTSRGLVFSSTQRNWSTERILTRSPGKGS